MGEWAYNPLTGNLDRVGDGSAPPGGVVLTINDLPPNGDGDFTIESGDGTVEVTDLPNGIDLSIPQKPMLSVRLRNSINVPQNTINNIMYDEVEIDTAGAWTAPFYVVPKTGAWWLSIQSTFDSPSGFTNCDAFITVDPVNFLTHGTTTATVSDPNRTLWNGGILVNLNQGDLLKVAMFSQTPGGNDITLPGWGNGFYNTFTAICQT